MADGGMGGTTRVPTRDFLGPTWSDEETAILKANWERCADEELAALLPGRSVRAITLRRSRLKLRRPEAVKAWTQREVNVLQGVEACSYDYLMRQLPGRTRVAIHKKMQELDIQLRQGTYSIAEVEELTGYDRRQLIRARDAIGQKWARTRDSRAPKEGTRYRRPMITDEQVEDLTAWLGRPLPIINKRGIRTDRWSLKHERCRRCGTQGSRPLEQHRALGYCDGCYRAVYQLPTCETCKAPIWTLFRLTQRAVRKRRHQAKRARLAAAREAR